MRVLVSGSHGFIGTALVARLNELGHEVTRLVRRPAEGEREISWNPAIGQLEPFDLEGFDAVVHLAGASIGEKRWTATEKLRILESRVQGTTLLAQALANTISRPAVFVSASAVGFYGNRGDDELTESSGKGEGFLSDVVERWETSTAPASEAGIRVVNTRSGIVLDPAGGALARQLPVFKMALGGRLGSGRQYLSWITLHDEIEAILHVIRDKRLSGPVNVTAPHPDTNQNFTWILGGTLVRPTWVPVWPWMLHAAFGKELTDEMLLASQRVIPAKLQRTGFRFRDEDLRTAIPRMLGKPLPGEDEDGASSTTGGGDSGGADGGKHASGGADGDGGEGDA